MQPASRNYRPNDLEPVVALLNAADSVDKTEDGTSLEETHTRFQTPGFNREQNVFVAEDRTEHLVGYADIRLAKELAENAFRTWFQIHPNERGYEFEERLLARLYTCAEERLSECDTAMVNFDSFTKVTARWRIEALERFGMHELRRFWLMVRPDLENLAQPQFPPGISTRAYRVKEDDIAMHAIDTQVFRDHWGHTEEPLEHWKHYVAWAAFKPDLTVIAENTASHEIAGYCSILINEDENGRLGVRRGWIDILGVRRPYRKHGLGTALLLAGLYNMREDGVQQAALGTDSENLTGATRIYERVGFVVHHTRAAYRKPMRGA